MPGAISENFHEGSRSEYLAQVAFSALGTVASIPHQEDFGIDFYCTLTERDGQRALVTDYFTVQVKSNTEPWTFETPESVKWLVAHPLPLFLCVVDRESERLSIYQTSPRFYMWSMSLPDHVALVPSEAGVGRCAQWDGGETFSVGAPILQFSTGDVEKKTHQAKIKNILRFWLDVDRNNLANVMTGTREFSMPYQYRTNEMGFGGQVTQSYARPTEDELELARESIKRQLGLFSLQLYNLGDRRGAVRAMLLLRHLEPMGDNFPGLLSDICVELNRALGKDNYLFTALDSLGAGIDSAAAQFLDPG